MEAEEIVERLALSILKVKYWYYGKICQEFQILVKI